MKITIIFDGQERHEYQTNIFDGTLLTPDRQPYAVEQMIAVCEKMIQPMVKATETQPQTPA